MRWKYFLPTVIITAVIVIFNIFFLDFFLKSAIVSSGEAIFKAKVEVGSLKTRFSDLSINIRGLAVASSGDEWKNMLEVDRIGFGIKPAPLLSMKFIIEELAVEGVRWGTARKTSGALPPKKLEKILAKEKKQDADSLTGKLFSAIQEKAKSEIKGLPAASSIKEAQQQVKSVKFDTSININDLQSVKEMEAMKTETAAKFAQYDAQIKDLKIDDKIALVSGALEEAKSIKLESLQDVEPAKQKLEKLTQSKTDIEKSMAEINALQSKLSADLGSEKDMLDRINKLREQDYQMLADKFKLPTFSMGNISEALFGPEWIGRVNSAIYYMHVARKYMPARGKSAKKIAKPSRSKGTNVSFPKADNPPDFLISRVILSGSTGGEGKAGDPMDFKGTVADITSDPAMLGRPTVALIDGKKGAQSLNIKGVLDHTKEIAEDTVSITYSGIDVKAFGLPKSDFLPDFSKGQAKVAGTLRMIGDEVDCSLVTTFSGLAYTISDEDKKDEFKKSLADMWAGISSFDVKTVIAGKPDGLKISVTSNVDSILSDRFKKITGEKLAEAQAKLKAEIDKLTNDKKNELMAQYTAKKDEAQKQLTDKQKELQSKIDELKSQLNAKQDAAKNAADIEKKKAEEALNAEKKKAEDAAAAEKKKLDDAAAAEKRKQEEAAAAEKKKQEDELKKQAEDKLKNMFK